MKNYWSVLLAALLITGCATGRTEFKVIKEPTPVPGLTVIQVPEVPAMATPVEEVKTPVEVNSDKPEERVSITEVVVQPGDTLSELCEKILNNAYVYPAIAQQNQIANPDLILPDQVIVFPTTQAERKMVSRPKVKPMAPKKGDAKKSAKIEFPQVENRAFAPGEKLTFSVEYFGISAGYATLSVAAGSDFYGRPTYHLMATARTHPAFEWFFKVRDSIESFVDKEGLFPWRYEKHLSEGSYKNDSAIVYRQMERKVSKENGKNEIEAPAWTQDVLSEFYYFRVLPLEIGRTIKIPVVADNIKVYELIVQVIKKERITVPAGTFDCIKVEPYLKFEGLFQHQGKMHIWITDDKRKVPVLIKSQIVIGTIDIVLRDAVVVDID